MIGQPRYHLRLTKLQKETLEYQWSMMTESGALIQTKCIRLYLNFELATLRQWSERFTLCYPAVLIGTLEVTRSCSSHKLLRALKIQNF